MTFVFVEAFRMEIPPPLLWPNKYILSRSTLSAKLFVAQSITLSRSSNSIEKLLLPKESKSVNSNKFSFETPLCEKLNLRKFSPDWAKILEIALNGPQSLKPLKPWLKITNGS